MDKSLHPPRLGDHELIRKISAGSYGEVWLARSELGAYRAVKIVRQSRFDSPRPFNREYEGIKRFEPISRSHEGFVDVLHVGRGPEPDAFYYVMELADDLMTGPDFDPETYRPRTLASEVAQRGPLAPDECVQIGIQLCRTLAYLHDRGLIHRDLKPSNVIFVGGQPKLADVGLIAGIQEAHTMVGTPGFIPPEGPNSIRADIYGLGKLLYEISTGNDRNEFPSLPERSSFSEAFLELNAVLVKACNSDANRRYQDAPAMAAELEVIATGKSVRRLQFLESRLKTIRKVGAALLAGIVALGFLYDQYDRHVQREREERATLIGNRVGQGTALLKQGDLLGALPAFVEAVKLDDLGVSAEATHRLRIGSILVNSPSIAWTAHLRDRPVRTCSLHGERAAVTLERKHTLVLDLGTGEVVGDQLGVESQPQVAAFLHDGETLLTANWDDTVRVLDWRSGRTLEKFEHPETVLAADASSDGQWIIAGCKDGSVYLWDRQNRTSRRLGQHEAFVLGAKFSSSGSLAVTSSADSTARVWDVATGHERFRVSPGNWVYNADFSPDERLLATASHHPEVKLWDVRSGEEIGPPLPHGGGVCAIQFRADGAVILTACLDGTARLWETRTHQPVGFNPVLKHRAKLVDASFSADGRRILTAGSDGTLTLWDFNEVPLKPQSLGKAPAIAPRRRLTSPDGRWQVRTNGSGLSIRLRRTRTRIDLNLTNSPALMGFDDHSRRFFAVDGSNVHSVDLDRCLSCILKHPTAVTHVKFSPDGLKLVCASADKSLDEMSAQIWDTVTGRPVGHPLEHDDGVRYACFSPDNRCVITGSEDFSAVIWDANTGMPLTPKMVHREKVYHAAFAATQPWVATASEDATAVIWDVKTGDPITPPFKHAKPLASVEFNDDDTALVTTDEDGNRWRWPLRIETRPVHELERLARPLAGMAKTSP